MVHNERVKIHFCKRIIFCILKQTCDTGSLRLCDKLCTWLKHPRTHLQLAGGFIIWWICWIQNGRLSTPWFQPGVWPSCWSLKGPRQRAVQDCKINWSDLADKTVEMAHLQNDHNADQTKIDTLCIHLIGKVLVNWTAGRKRWRADLLKSDKLGTVAGSSSSDV